MSQERAGEIALMLLAVQATEKNLGQLPIDFSNIEAGKAALEIVKIAALKRNWRFEGVRAEAGRLAQQTGITQKEIHQFAIEQILPYVIAQGFTATGEIRFAY